MTNQDNLTTLDGIQAYLSAQILPVLKEQVATHGQILPMGIVFARRDNDTNLDELQAIGVHPAGEDRNAEKGVRARTRLRAINTHAEGVVLVRQENRKVVFQLEHPTLGDLVWDITVHNVRDTDELPAPRTPEQAGVPRTTFSPTRYMN